MATFDAAVALFSTSGAYPEMFGYHPVDWITSPAGENGEVEWSTSDMIISKGEPQQVAPRTIAWAFAFDDAPDFGVMLVPVGGGIAIPSLWDRGFINVRHWGEGKRLTDRSSSMWLNALADFQHEVLHDPPDQP